MEKWKEIALSKEEEEDCVTVPDEEISEDESFGRTLVGKLWVESSYNIRAFKQTMVQAWRLENEVEVQDLSKNLYLFQFSTKRDAEWVFKNGPWRFDRNLLILNRVTGDEQPSDLEMNTVAFWIRVYDLPLKLRTDVMAKRLGDSIGVFDEVDQKKENRSGRFLRIRTRMDLRKPLKRGTVVKYQGKNLKVFFKYERLTTFCFVCGKIGHQIRDCDEVVSQDNEGYEELEEKEQPFGLWMRASPLPKYNSEPQRDNKSSSCSKNLFPKSSSSKVEGTVANNKVVVQQSNSQNLEVAMLSCGSKDKQSNSEKVEKVAESLGTFAIGKEDVVDGGARKDRRGRRKLIAKKGGTKNKDKKHSSPGKKMLGKRGLVEVHVSEGNIEDFHGVNKKMHMEVDAQFDYRPEGVLNDQHLLPQRKHGTLSRIFPPMLVDVGYVLGT